MSQAKSDIQTPSLRCSDTFSEAFRISSSPAVLSRPEAEAANALIEETTGDIEDIFSYDFLLGMAFVRSTNLDRAKSIVARTLTVVVSDSDSEHRNNALLDLIRVRRVEPSLLEGIAQTHPIEVIRERAAQVLGASVFSESCTFVYLP